jgi:thioredoxin 2
MTCKTKNRIPADKVGQEAKCGKCRNRIPTDILQTAHTLTVTDKDFHERVIRSPLPTLVDCWAPWCGPCQMMGPVMEELAAQWKGRGLVCKLNVDENSATASQYQIRSVPTLLIFDNGMLKDTLNGAAPKTSILKAMSPFLAKG